MRIHLLIVLLLLVSSTYALEECLREQQNTEIPCYLVTSWTPPNNCTTYQADLYTENGSFLYSESFSTIGNSGRCEVTFNETKTGQYYGNSSLDTWNVTVFQKDNMLSIILLQIFIVSFFILLSIPHKAGSLAKIIGLALGLIEFIIAVWMVYIDFAGGDLENLLYINALIMLIVGGFYGILSLFALNVKMMNPQEDEKVAEDGYTKYMFGK